MNLYTNFNLYKKSIYDFLHSKNILLKPFPKIIFNNTPVNRFDPSIKTGTYNVLTNTIEIYINNRHLKDILRTLFHELIHHYQYINNRLNPLNNESSITNTNLREIESEAYTQGNLLFREWTESIKNNVAN